MTLRRWDAVIADGAAEVVVSWQPSAGWSSTCRCTGLFCKHIRRALDLAAALDPNLDGGTP